MNAKYVVVNLLKLLITNIIKSVKKCLIKRENNLTARSRETQINKAKLSLSDI